MSESEFKEKIQNAFPDRRITFRKSGGDCVRLNGDPKKPMFEKSYVLVSIDASFTIPKDCFERSKLIGTWCENGNFKFFHSELKCEIIF
jgi:hypothetical protein